MLQNNPTPRKHMIETMAGGVAAFEYNNDGKVKYLSSPTARQFQASKRTLRSFSIGFTVMTVE